MLEILEALLIEMLKDSIRCMERDTEALKRLAAKLRAEREDQCGE